jgi:ribosomal protein S18 acetylase RimI-like enzyme
MKFIFADNSIAEKIRLEFGDELAGYLNFENGFTIAAMDGEKIAGFVSASIEKLPYNFENKLEVFIDVIEIKKEYRRQGIARKLLSLIEKEAKKYKAYQIRAWSSEDKKEAIVMWNNFGYFLHPQEIISAVTKKPVRGYFAGKVLG